MILPIATESKSERMMLNRTVLEDYNPLIQAGLYGLGKRITEQLPSEAEKTAVLYGKTNELLKNNLMILSTYPQILYGEAKRGRRTTAFNHATLNDLERVLLDDSFQNLILFGQGTPYEWLATDGWASLEYLDSLDFIRKRGEIIKLTDNNGNGLDEFALRIASNPDNAKQFVGKTYQSQIFSFLRERVDEYQVLNRRN